MKGPPIFKEMILFSEGLETLDMSDNPNGQPCYFRNLLPTKKPLFWIMGLYTWGKTNNEEEHTHLYLLSSSP